MLYAPVDCKICHNKVSRGGKSTRDFGTTGMIQHLQRKHLDKYDEYQRLNKEVENSRKRAAVTEEASSSSSTSVQEAIPKKQISLQQSFQRSVQFEYNHPRSQAITRLIASMMARDNQPFSIVQDTGFVNLINYLEPRYKIPCRTTFSRTVITDMYEKVKSEVMNRICGADWLSFTSDGWTSDNNLDGFISLTAHWISKNWSREYALLSLKSVPGSHTGEVIKSVLLKSMTDWKIPEAKRFLMVRDNASAMAKATELMKIASQPCFIHTLQLEVGDGLKEQRAVIDVLAVGRAMVGHFRYSSLATSKLERKNKVEQLGVKPGNELRVIQDVTTRWNSSFYMLERLLKLKSALTLYAVENDALKVFTTNQWDLANKLVTTLLPFEEKTRQASMDNACIGVIIPSVRSILSFLQKQDAGVSGLGSMRTAMAASLKRRYADMLTQKKLLISTTLMPAYKLHWFETQETKELAEFYIIEEAMLLHDASDVQLQQSQGHSLSAQANPMGSSPTTGTSSSQNAAFSSTQTYQDEPVPPTSFTPINSTTTSNGKYWHLIFSTVFILLFLI